MSQPVYELRTGLVRNGGPMHFVTVLSDLAVMRAVRFRRSEARSCGASGGVATGDTPEH